MLTATATDGSESWPLAVDAPKATPLNKSAFIRGLPSHLSPTEVVAHAKEHGLTIDRACVGSVRIAARDRAARLAPFSVAPASAPPSPKPVTESKVVSIRPLPSEVSYAEAAANGQDAGIALSPTHFYVARSRAKKGAQEAAIGAPAHHPLIQASPASAFKGLRLASDDAREQALINAAWALSVSRTKTVLALMARFEVVTAP